MGKNMGRRTQEGESCQCNIKSKIYPISESYCVQLNGIMLLSG